MHTFFETGAINGYREVLCLMRHPESTSVANAQLSSCHVYMQWPSWFTVFLGHGQV
jgi:hypothetical protein